MYMFRVYKELLPNFHAVVLDSTLLKVKLMLFCVGSCFLPEVSVLC